MLISVNDVTNLISEYDALLKRVEKLIDEKNFCADRLFFGVDSNGEISITAQGTQVIGNRGLDSTDYSIPAKWLFMSDYGIKAEKELIRKEETENMHKVRESLAAEANVT